MASCDRDQAYSEQHQRHVPGYAQELQAAFDKLPREVRDALNGANFPFAPQRLRTMLRRGASVEEVVQLVRHADRKETARAERSS